MEDTTLGSLALTDSGFLSPIGASLGTPGARGQGGSVGLDLALSSSDGYPASLEDVGSHGSGDSNDGSLPLEYTLPGDTSARASLSQTHIRRSVSPVVMQVRWFGWRGGGPGTHSV
jgi:hypothetical protein